MSYQIRPMTDADIASARELWSNAEGVELAEGDNAEEIARFLARNPGLSTVATDETGAVIGAVMCGQDGRRGYAYHLAVGGGYRGQGVGRAIMQRSLAELKRTGVRRALLLVEADNDAGKHFWMREGWEEMPFAQPMGIDL